MKMHADLNYAMSLNRIKGTYANLDISDTNIVQVTLFSSFFHQGYILHLHFSYLHR
jgi:hypothetical protein